MKVSRFILEKKRVRQIFRICSVTHFRVTSLANPPDIICCLLFVSCLDCFQIMFSTVVNLAFASFSSKISPTGDMTRNCLRFDT